MDDPVLIASPYNVRFNISAWSLLIYVQSWRRWWRHGLCLDIKQSILEILVRQGR